MGSRRSEALNTLLELNPEVILHLEKIRAHPDAWASHHWRTEVRGWLRQMERELGRIGKRTRAEWKVRIDGWWNELGG